MNKNINQLAKVGMSVEEGGYGSGRPEELTITAISETRFSLKYSDGERCERGESRPIKELATNGDKNADGSPRLLWNHDFVSKL